MTLIHGPFKRILATAATALQLLLVLPVLTEDVHAQNEAAYDSKGYSQLLARHVKDGMVDYKVLKEDASALEHYIQAIGRLDPATLKAFPRREKLAFYINAYNAFTLKAILDNYPVNSIKDIRGVWDRLQFNVAGEKMTLNHIEHEIIRKQIADPRAHFALVCASIGCPKLRPEAYTAEGINDQLNEEARNFIGDPTKVRLEKDRRTLRLSPIFKWFKGDFGDILHFVARYLPEDDARFVREQKVRVRYLKNYDWSINDQK